jgi:DNA-binding MarR family transcriptional regulator
MTDRTPPTQSRVLACIRRYPGIHLRAIERELALSSALVHYHVKQLEGRGAIVSAPVGGYLRFYPKEVEESPDVTQGEMDLIAYLREEVPLHVILILLERGPVPQSTLAEDLDLAKSTVSYHVDKMAARDLLERETRSGGERVIRVKEPARLRRLLETYAPTKDLHEKFRDLWDDFYGAP